MKIILPHNPEQVQPGVLEKETPFDDIAIGTTTGFDSRKNLVNEDRVGCLIGKNAIRLCIADGHWGDAAADMAARFWLKDQLVFPRTREAAVAEAMVFQDSLRLRYYHEDMTEQDRTPEAAFIAAELDDKTLRLVSYGDCRLMVLRQDGHPDMPDTMYRPYYTHSQLATWLGAFSSVGRRERLTVNEGLEFRSLPVKPDDVLLLFTDGIDECVYETSSIGQSQLAAFVSASRGLPSFALEAIFSDVYEHGAQDHASLAVVRI